MLRPCAGFHFHSRCSYEDSHVQPGSASRRHPTPPSPTGCCNRIHAPPGPRYPPSQAILMQLTAPPELPRSLQLLALGARPQLQAPPELPRSLLVQSSTDDSQLVVAQHGLDAGRTWRLARHCSSPPSTRPQPGVAKHFRERCRSRRGLAKHGAVDAASPGLGNAALSQRPRATGSAERAWAHGCGFCGETASRVVLGLLWVTRGAHTPS